MPFGLAIQELVWLFQLCPFPGAGGAVRWRGARQGQPAGLALYQGAVWLGKNRSPWCQ